MLWLAPALTAGSVTTDIVTCPVLVQPTPLVPVTVYAVVTAGVAMGLVQLVHERPVAGVQVKLGAPDADRGTEPPAQIEVFGVTVSIGVLFTVTVTIPVSLQPSDVPVTV